MTDMNTHSKTGEHIQLDAANADTRVVVTPNDQDRFVMTCASAIEACKRHESNKIVDADVIKLIAHCRSWASERSSKISSAYIGPHESKITVFVVPKTDHFDFDLAEEIAQLSHELSRDFQAIWTDAVEVPNCDEDQLLSFIDPEQVMRIDG